MKLGPLQVGATFWAVAIIWHCEAVLIRWNNGIRFERFLVVTE